jgi:hypothetical protein
MAYAGICGAQIFNQTDAYFRQEFTGNYAKLASTTVPFITFDNDAPVAASTPDYTIPISTPFVLTASVSDANNDPLTYCWEQYDLESPASEPPASNDSNGPLFRSFLPVTIPQRYFPRLSDLAQNISPVWEVLPSVSRTMTFRMTARDYHSIAGLLRILFR